MATALVFLLMVDKHVLGLSERRGLTAQNDLVKIEVELNPDPVGGADSLAPFEPAYLPTPARPLARSERAATWEESFFGVFLLRVRFARHHGQPRAARHGQR